MKLDKVFHVGFWKQLSIALFHGKKHYPSVYVWGCWKSYVGLDGKTYYDHWGTLSNWLKYNAYKASEDKLMAAIEEYNKSVPSRLKSYVNINDYSY